MTAGSLFKARVASSTSRSRPIASAFLKSLVVFFRLDQTCICPYREISLACRSQAYHIHQGSGIPAHRNWHLFCFLDDKSLSTLHISFLQPLNLVPFISRRRNHDLPRKNPWVERVMALESITATHHEAGSKERGEIQPLQHRARASLFAVNRTDFSEVFVLLRQLDLGTTKA